jgi:uncharacterized protein YecT (DUF1311 family)
VIHFAPRPSPIASPRLFGAVPALALVLALAACDTSKPATASEAASAAGVASAAGAAVACPSQDLKRFVAAFAEDPALQKAFTAARVDTAFVDMNAQPEPAESVETLARERLRFPVMPNRAQQQQEGLQYREVSVGPERALVALEVPDTDAQLLYTFRRDACWTLVKIVDPAFGKAFPGEAPVPAAQTSRPAAPVASAATPAGDDRARGLSNTFGECMAGASGNIAQAQCLTDERDRQDARLNKVYQALIAQLQGASREKMVDAQRAWLQSQQKGGAFEAAVLDALGPMGNLQQVENEARAIAQRADLLEQYVDLTQP